jgi:hypothetical protein
MLAEGDDHRLLLGRQNGGAYGLRTHRRIMDEELRHLATVF